MNLARRVIDAAGRAPDAIAVRGNDDVWTYGSLDAEANRIAHALAAIGVRRGSRVGIWMAKSGRAVAAMQAVLRLGAAYVPIDPASPARRAHAIIEDCDMTAVVADDAQDVAAPLLDWGDVAARDSSPTVVDMQPDELAYILYTSGSTGKPKGVCISHRNCLAFVDWAVREIRPNEQDRFSSHAPFHFDLSVLDLYAAFTVGASVSIVPDGMSYVPRQLVEFLCREQISIWYSVPSALILMMEHGGLLEASPAWRTVLFAGESFPVKHLRRLKDRFDARLLNLYGPTETNVCTFHEVLEIDSERASPVPIGRAASGNECWAVRDDGEIATVGEEGELFVSGPTVMLGYWGQPSQKGAPYPTGDVVRVLDDGAFEFVGRRDHMVKVRGHRIELGEVEAALLAHEHVRNAAVVVAETGMDARLVAFLEVDGQPPSLLALKGHCAGLVPRYMIVDEVAFVDALPTNRNGKIDRVALSALAEKKDSA